MPPKDKPKDTDYKLILAVHAEAMAKATLHNINKTVPVSVKGMRYARQYVLEETIRLLQEAV